MKIIKITFTALLALIINTNVFSQAKRAEVMVLPEYDWCIANGYFKEFDDQGEKIKIPDYDKAFTSNSELRNAISTVQSIMAERNYPLKDLRASERSVNNRNARRAARRKTASENPIDALLRNAKADILLYISWTVYNNGPNKNIAFNLIGTDAYSDKAIAPVEGNEVKSSAANINELVRASIINKMDEFCYKLDTHMEGILANGREITFSIEVEEDALDDYLNTRFEGTPLNRIIRSWVSENTVNRNFSIESSSEDYIDFSQVRIKTYDDDGIALDASTWAEGLVDMLESKYKLRTSVDEMGLGRVEILIIK